MNLEARYRDYLRWALRARQAERAMQVSLQSGDKATAEVQLQRRWRALLRMREALDEAWPGLRIYARRQLWTLGEADHEAALERLWRALREAPPPLSGSRLPVAGLYAHVRRTLAKS